MSSKHKTFVIRARLHLYSCHMIMSWINTKLIFSPLCLFAYHIMEKKMQKKSHLHCVYIREMRPLSSHAVFFGSNKNDSSKVVILKRVGHNNNMVHDAVVRICD